uniref:Large ribosomal subunit protein uL2 n=1 Tax=Buteo japonicus TaxID=224669 RepID=A0A8B9Z659_9AVES
MLYAERGRTPQHHSIQRGQRILAITIPSAITRDLRGALYDVSGTSGSVPSPTTDTCLLRGGSCPTPRVPQHGEGLRVFQEGPQPCRHARSLLPHLPPHAFSLKRLAALPSLVLEGKPAWSADIALVAGGNRKRWIIATENMQPGDIIKNSSHIGRMAVLANEGDAYPLGALPVGTLICNLESHPGKGAQYIRAAGTCGVLLRKVNGTAIVQLPSKRHMQVLETCVATVGRVSNVDHNKRVIGKAGRNRWLGKRPHTGLWHRKGGWAGRKIKPLPPMKSYVNLPRVTAQE